MLSYYIHHHLLESVQDLSVAERKSVNRFLTLLKQGQITPGMRPHKVGAFLSLSVNMDLRVLAVDQGQTITLVHVGHHDPTYQWANQTSLLDSHIDITELVDISRWNVPEHVVGETHLPIPVQHVLGIQDSDMFLHAISGMSPEWQEWLFELYTNPSSSTNPPNGSSFVYCPDDDAELFAALALDVPSWRVLLHPVQQDAVENAYSKSIAVVGGPGTGKTAVLLNRLITHGPKGKDADCAVLLTYTQELAGELERMIRAMTNRHVYVLPLYFLAGKQPTNAWQHSLEKIKIVVQDGDVFVIYNNKIRRHVRELLIDEFQDAPGDVTQLLNTIIRSDQEKGTRIVLAADIHQSIYRPNQDNIQDLLAKCEESYELSYCYRSTQQIIEKATRWLSQFGGQPSSAAMFGLSGAPVRIVECADIEQQITVTMDVMLDLVQRYASDGLAVIYVQYFNKAYRGPKTEEETLQNHPELKKYYRYANLTKGQEYFAGVLFISETFLARDLPDNQRRLRLNTLYVALTRFRDEVTIIYTSNSAAREFLGTLVDPLS